jgi:hypothetical protein
MRSAWHRKAIEAIGREHFPPMKSANVWRESAKGFAEA